jgi:hypothetical protein
MTTEIHGDSSLLLQNRLQIFKMYLHSDMMEFVADIQQFTRMF